MDLDDDEVLRSLQSSPFLPAQIPNLRILNLPYPQMSEIEINKSNNDWSGSFIQKVTEWLTHRSRSWGSWRSWGSSRSWGSLSSVSLQPWHILGQLLFSNGNYVKLIHNNLLSLRSLVTRGSWKSRRSDRTLCFEDKYIILALSWLQGTN